MTFSTFKNTSGRQAANVLELDLDYCSLSYGVSPCTATLALRNDLNWSQKLDETTVGATPGWQGGAFITPDAATAPDGSTTADELARIIATDQEVLTFQDLDDGLNPQASNTVQVLAWQVKSKPVGGVPSERYVELTYMSSLANFNFAIFDIIDGHLVQGGDYTDTTFLAADIFPVRDTTEDGWFKIVLAYNSKVAPGVPQIALRLAKPPFNSNGLTSGAIGDGVYLWAAQKRPLGGIGQASLYTGSFRPGKYAVRETAVIDGMGGVEDLCFNAFGNCQDTANFNKVPRTLRFIDTLQRPHEFLDAYPAILSVRYAPTVLKPGGNLSIRGQVTVVLQDFATTDNEIDDYVDDRTYNPEDQGTFFGKLKARHEFYIGRPMRVLEGYLDNQSLSDFRIREYIIDDISGPTADGKVIVTGKDILSLAADVRAKAPTASTNTLRAAMDTTQTTLLPQVGEAVVMIAGDKHVRLNDEIIELVSESPTDTLNVVRAKGGTTGSAHAIDDGIQECKTYEDTPVIDVVQELLEDFANVPPSFIPFADWQDEEAASLSGYDMTTIISEPTGVLTLLKEIAAITLLDIWYDDVAQEVKLKLQTPFTSVTESVNDEEDILADTLKVKDLNNQRLTRILIYYNMRNFARDLTETENFSFINFEIEADKEGINKYNDERIKVIFTRWFDSTNSVQVALTSTRLLDRFGITPKAITFDLDAKDVERLTTGDVFDLRSRIEQDLDGTKATNRYQVVETKAIKPGSQYRYKCEAFFQDPTPENIVINSNQIDFDLFVALGGPPAAVDVTVTIDAGITVFGSNGNPAFTTAGLHPDSTLILINNGEIHGYGGNGGAAGFGTTAVVLAKSCRYNWTGGDGGEQGQEGGDALLIEISAVDIDNTNGEIFGGGGGGGGGDREKGGILDSVYNGGGGGGGGLGEDTSDGGAGGIITQGSEACSTTRNDGPAGTGGTDITNGTGGDVTDPDGFDGGDGANDWGVTGDKADVSGGAGGIGGFAVRLNGASIVFQGGDNPAQIKGDVA